MYNVRVVVCVVVCVRVCVCVSVSTDAHVKVREQPQLSAPIFRHVFWGTGSLCRFATTDASLAIPRVSRYSSVPIPHLLIGVPALQTHATKSGLMRILGIWTQVPYFHSKHFTS